MNADPIGTAWAAPADGPLVTVETAGEVWQDAHRARLGFEPGDRVCIVTLPELTPGGPIRAARRSAIDALGGPVWRVDSPLRFTNRHGVRIIAVLWVSA